MASSSDVGTASPAFFGFAGAVLALLLSNIGAAIGSTFFFLIVVLFYTKI
jgi:hypothetical protein